MKVGANICNLPESHKAHKQEESSILALRNILKNKNFIIREIKDKDYGVDLNLETEIVGNKKKYASNFICQVQLKDIINGEKIKNTDGSYSYPIKTSTINYLLNQPASLIMIYMEDKDQIVWEWVNEIEKYAINKEVNINTQESFTYRFSKILNSKEIDAIYKQIIRIGHNIKNYKEFILNNRSVDIAKQEDIISSYHKTDKRIKECVKNKDFSKALKLATNLANIMEDADSFNLCAKLSYYLGEYKRAVKFCKKSIKLNSNDSVTYLIKGSSLNRLGDYKKAKKTIKNSLAIRETSEAYAELGLVEFLLNNFNDATELFEKSIELDNGYEIAYLYLGQMYTSIFSFSKAKYYLQKVLDINPKNTHAFVLLGENYQNQDMYRDAIESFHKSLDYDSENYKGLIGLGLTLISEGSLEKGLIYISKWCSIYHKKILNNEKGILIVNIGWNETVHFAINSTNNKKEIKLVFGDGREIPVRLPNKNDNIYIGTISEKEGEFNIPTVGKLYAKENTFNYIKKELENRLELINFRTGTKDEDRYMESSNSTKLLIEEEKDRVYIELNFNGFAINGHTNGKYQKKGFNEFVRSYEKHGFYQVNLYCKETKEEICFTVNENVTLKIQEPSRIS